MVTGYLIPIKELSSPALAAVRFALEFGKRNGGAFYFLFVDDPGAPGAGTAPIDAAGPPQTGGAPGRDEVWQTIEAQIAQARTQDGLQVQSIRRRGDFIQEIRQVVRDYHIAEIIFGVLDEPQDTPVQSHPDALLLHQLTHCRILTVKPIAKEQA
jgi:nucleotide-binding universal stress UspA family protein